MIEDEKHSFGPELIKGIVFSFVSLFLLVHIPFINAVSVILVPLPVFHYCLRLGPVPGILVFALSLIPLYGLMGLIGTGDVFTLILIFGLIGILLSEVVRLGYGFNNTIILSSLSFFGAGLFFLFLDAVREGLSLWEVLRVSVARFVEANIHLYGQIDPGADQLKAMRANIDRIADAILVLVPGLALVTSGIIAIINIIAAKYIFLRYSAPFPDYGDLSHWRVPEKMIWVLIAAGFTLFFPVEVARIVGVNLLVVLLFLYVLNGIALVEFFQKKVGVSIFFRVVFYLLILVVPFALIATCFAGLMDVWVDFRRRYGTETA